MEARISYRRGSQRLKLIFLYHWLLIFHHFSNNWKQIRYLKNTDISCIPCTRIRKLSNQSIKRIRIARRNFCFLLHQWKPPRIAYQSNLLLQVLQWCLLCSESISRKHSEELLGRDISDKTEFCRTGVKDFP